MQKNKIGVWGLGIVGTSAIKYFCGKGFVVELLDRRIPTAAEQEFLKAQNVVWFGQEDLKPFLERNNYIMPSCGIDLRPYAQYQHKWLSELDLFAAECTTPIIAITGSVGKTTVTHLLSHLLCAQNKKVFTGGNIGVGLLESLSQANACDYVVIEASSFQLERCKTFSPFMALCTNIFANHLDRHDGFEQYVEAKLKIIGISTQKIVFPIALVNQIPEHIRTTQSINFFSSAIPSPEEVSLIGDLHKIYYLHNSKLMIRYQTITRQIFDFIELPFISYAQNVVILAAALDILGYNLDNFVEVLNHQELPEHRLEKVATINNIDFYNDSKATIPASTLAAIEKIKDRPIVLFLGGVSKGVDRSEFIKQIPGCVRMVYCFGKEAEQLKVWCDAHAIPAQAFATLDQAFTYLPEVVKPNDQILFSPAGASFDLFANYAERGNYFKNLVLNFEKNSCF